MLSRIVPIAAAIRKRALDGRLEQFEERIVGRLGLLAHIVIRSGSDGHPNESAVSEGVARDALERLARSAGFTDAVDDIVDYGVMLVLIAIHICRQTNLKGDVVLDHARFLLQDAANATATITPPPSFNDPQNAHTAVLMTSRADPCWSLISAVIEKLRAEILAEIPADNLTEHNILSAANSWHNQDQDTPPVDFSAPSLQKYLLTDTDNAAVAELGESNDHEAVVIDGNPGPELQSVQDGIGDQDVPAEGQYHRALTVAPFHDEAEQDDENDSALMVGTTAGAACRAGPTADDFGLQVTATEPARPAASPPITSIRRAASTRALLLTASEEGGESAQATAAATASLPHDEHQQTTNSLDNDEDETRYLQEILAVLVRLQDGQTSMTQEIQQLKQTIDKASAAAARGADGQQPPSPSSSRRQQHMAAPADDWRRMRKARISEINFDPPPPPARSQTAPAVVPESDPTESSQPPPSSSSASTTTGGMPGQHASPADTAMDDKKPLVQYREMEIETTTPEDAWSDADRNQPSYRPSIVVSGPRSSLSTSSQDVGGDAVRGSTPPPDVVSSGKRDTLNEPLPDDADAKSGGGVPVFRKQSVRRSRRWDDDDDYHLSDHGKTIAATTGEILKSAREAIANAMSDEPLHVDRRHVRHPTSETDSDRAGIPRATCSCAQQTRTRRRPPPHAWTASSESETSARVRHQTLPESDDDDGRLPLRSSVRRHESSRRKSPGHRSRRSTKRFEDATRSSYSRRHSPECESARWQPPSPSKSAYEVGSYRPPSSATARLYGFPECCLNLRPAPRYDLYSGTPPMADSQLWQRHSDCRYCRLERLGLRLKACSFCP